MRKQSVTFSLTATLSNQKFPKSCRSGKIKWRLSSCYRKLCGMIDVSFKGRPTKVKRYLLNQSENLPVDDFSDELSQRNVFDSLCPENDPKAAPGEMSTCQLDSVTTVLSKFKRTPSMLQKKVKNLCSQLASPSLILSLSRAWLSMEPFTLDSSTS